MIRTIEGALGQAFKLAKAETAKGRQGHVGLVKLPIQGVELEYVGHLEEVFDGEVVGDELWVGVLDHLGEPLEYKDANMAQIQANNRKRALLNQFNFYAGNAWGYCVLMPEDTLIPIRIMDAGNASKDPN